MPEPGHPDAVPEAGPQGPQPRAHHEGALERVFAEPAELLDESVEALGAAERALVSKKPIKAAEEYWNTLGPGLVTGAADDDPSGIATYSQTGAQYGPQLLWMSWVMFPLMATVQEMCGRIGVVTGRGLAANIDRHYSRRALYFVTILLFAANVFNIGADLGAMAQGVQLIVPRASFALLVIFFAVASLLLQIYTTYARYSRYLKYLAFVLFAYIASALLSDLDWGMILRATVIPSITFSKEQLLLVCAILGTTISPYLFFWQTSQEVETETLRTHREEHGWHRRPSKKSMRRMQVDIWSGMFLSEIVMFFIIAACAGTLYTHGITDITTAAQAAAALKPFAGNAAYVLFAVGIVGTGMLAIPVLAGSTSYAISESFGWKHGLYKSLKEAYAFYGVIIVSMLLGILMNFIGLDPMKALIYSAVGNGLIAPIVLYFIVRLSSDPEIMRDHVNCRRTTLIGWITVWSMAVAGVMAIITLFL